MIYVYIYVYIYIYMYIYIYVYIYMYIYNTHTHTHYTGHALEIEKLGGAKIVVDGSSYTLREMVTHTPSEHRIHGQAMDLELQLVHVRFFFL